jgi:hypothetical protein
MTRVWTFFTVRVVNQLVMAAFPVGLFENSRGGQLVAYGTPETVAGVKDSYTGHFLAKVLQPDALEKRLIA